MRFLLQFLQGIMPVTRINIVGASKYLHSFIPIWDSDPAGISRTRKMHRNGTFPIVAQDKLAQPVILNDLSLLKSAVQQDDSVRDLPFFTSEALARLPLFEWNSFLYLINFWASQPDSFRPWDPALLKDLIAPLSGRLREALMEESLPAFSLSEHSDALETLDLYRGLYEMRAAVRRVAPTNSTVLLTGETGSGKGLMAEAIHALSTRASGPFVAINCGAIMPSLLESELFGSEKGAYTGSTQLRYGYFEFAGGGTLFLDEIGELPLGAQAHILHALEKRIIQRVGSPRPIPVDVRIVAATNRDLREMVRAGTFREDLYYRLSIYPIHVPPLRRRRLDILPLARHFLAAKAGEMGLKIPGNIPDTEAARLVAHDWPGNVRELANVVERALINHERGKPLVFELEKTPGADKARDEDWPTLRELEERYLRKVLAKTGGNMAEAARVLGIHYTTLHAKVKRLGGAATGMDAAGAGRRRRRDGSGQEALDQQ